MSWSLSKASQLVGPIVEFYLLISFSGVSLHRDVSSMGMSGGVGEHR
jgi:hypothetical protein